MTGTNYIFDGTEENFQQLAVENSKKGLVLVNFWTAKAGPCLKLWQVLESLSQEYKGRFLLVNVNTDTQKRLVRETGITSVPTVKIFNNGTVVESIHGAQSASSLRPIINKYLPSVLNPAIAQALHAYQNGAVMEALKILADASRKEPDDIRLHATSMKLLFRERHYADVAKYHADLSDLVKGNNEIRQVAIHAELLQMAEQAPSIEELDQHLRDHPEDFASLLKRAALALLQDDYEYALECLFYVFRQDRQYRDGFPHKAMLSLFALLGKDHSLTKEFQQRMQEILH